MTTAGELTLVAGGAGFIGSHLCRALLKKGTNVLCLDNLQTARRENLLELEAYERFRFVEADITRPLPRQVLEQTGRITRIYNLACAASPDLYQADPEHTILTCVMGTNRLLHLAEDSGARFLLTSTSEVYGDPDVHPQTESYRGNVSCTGPRACYDEGKRAAETMAFDFARGGRADVRVARIFNTYGPNMRMDDGRVISNFICQALAGKPLTIYGNGEQTRSFCYVSDTVDGLLRLMESEDGDLGPVNIGNPSELTIAELIETLETVMGVRLAKVSRPLPVDDPKKRRPDIARATERLGWSPRTPLASGLAATVAWFERELRSNRTRKTGRAPAAAVAAVGGQQAL